MSIEHIKHTADDSRVDNAEGKRMGERLVEGSALTEQQQRAVLRELPEHERGNVRCVLSESAPPEGKAGVMSYMGLFELADGRWAMVDVMLEGLRNVSTIRVAGKNITKGNTEVSGVEKRSSIIIDTPARILDPLVMPSDVFLRLHRKLAYKLIELGKANGDYTQLLLLPIWGKFPEQGDERPETHESVEGIEPPKKSDRDRLMGGLKDPGTLEQRRRALEQ